MLINGKVSITAIQQTIGFPGRRQMPTKRFNVFWVYFDSAYQTLGGQLKAGKRWISWGQTDVHPFEVGGEDSATPFSALDGTQKPIDYRTVNGFVFTTDLIGGTLEYIAYWGVNRRR